MSVGGDRPPIAPLRFRGGLWRGIWRGIWRGVWWWPVARLESRLRGLVERLMGSRVPDVFPRSRLPRRQERLLGNIDDRGFVGAAGGGVVADRGNPIAGHPVDWSALAISRPIAVSTSGRGL